MFNISKNFQKKNYLVRFIINEFDKNSLKILKNNKFKVHSLKIKNKNLTILEDAKLTREFIIKKKINSPYLIIDNYKINKNWESILKKIVYKIIVIDDMMISKHNCDLLINQNYSIKNQKKYYDELIPKNCKLLNGTKYALLRPEFIKLRKISKPRKKLNKILISFGGADPTNETIKVLKAFKNINLEKLKLIVIAGHSNSNKKNIKKLTDQIINSKFYTYSEKIGYFMVNSDLAIGGAGTTTWERCCLGLPSIISILSVNQKQIGYSLSKINCVKNLGIANKLSIKDYESAIQKFDNKTLQQMSKNCKKLVDGKGANRVVNEILLL